MSIVPGVLLPGPEPLRRRYGLLTAASGPMDLDTHGRGGGVRYVPVTCGEAHPYAVSCYNGQVVTHEKEGDPENGEVVAPSFSVVATIECGALGYTAAEFEAKVQRRLTNGEQGAAETALWTGESPQGDSLDIVSLATDPDAVAVGDDQDIVAVIAALEDYAYREVAYGNVAFIHAPVAVASWAADRYLVIDDGPLKRTPYGSIWVFGGGYPNEGGIHITGQVNIWRSPDIFTYPADQTMDRSTNQRLLVAEREYAIGFDCFNGRADFDPLGVTSP